MFNIINATNYDPDSYRDKRIYELRIVIRSDSSMDGNFVRTAALILILLRQHHAVPTANNSFPHSPIPPFPHFHFMP